MLLTRHDFQTQDPFRPDPSPTRHQLPSPPSLRVLSRPRPHYRLFTLPLLRLPSAAAPPRLSSSLLRFPQPLSPRPPPVDSFILFDHLLQVEFLLSSSILRDSAEQIYQNQDMADQLESLYQRMGKLAGEVCPMCLARVAIRNHPLVNCNDLPDDYIQEVIRPFKDKMKQVRYMLCWSSWLPKPKGDVKFHQDQRCVFYPCVLPEALCCLWASPLRQEALTDLHIDVETEEEWGNFLRADLGRGKMQTAWKVENWLLGRVGL